MTTTIYHIDSSARQAGSTGRTLAAEVVAHLAAGQGTRVIYRDASKGLEFLTPAAIDGLYIPDAARTDEQRAALRLSDALVQEIREADYLVIAAPVYNFGPPASLKAWADLVARKDLTFRYGPKGPEGLLRGIKAYVVVTSGGVPVGSPADHLSPWIRTFLGFIGVTDVTILGADQLVTKATESLARVRAQIEQIA